MRRSTLLALVWVSPSVIFVALTFAVYHAYRIEPQARLDAAGRTCVMAPLREALEDRDAPPCTLAIARPIAVTVWSGGRAIVRVDGTLADVARSLRDAAQLRALAPDARAAARIQVYVIGDRAPLGGGYWLFARLAVPGTADMLAINSGLEGIGADVAGKTILLLPHELITGKLLAAKRPSDEMPDFAMGVDPTRIAQVIATRAATHEPISSMWRFRTDAFAEPARASVDRTPLQLTRGIPPAPPLTAQALRDAALAGAHYLVNHLAPSGRFIYEHDLVTGHETDPSRPSDYSMPRHGGTTYFLAQMYRITKEPWLREPIERAIAHLVELLGQGHCGGTL